MKVLIAKYMQRIDAASLRERVLIFLAFVLVVVFIANATLLEPLRVKQKRLAAENTQRQQELQKLVAEFQKLARVGQEDPDAANRKRVASLRQELEQLSARIAKEQRRFTPPDQMRMLLEDMLQRNKRLTIVELKTLPVLALGGANVSGLYRHGIELTVSGSYVDLYDYLRSLESSPTQLYWGRADLAVTEYPSNTLKLTVYTVSLDRTWLIV